MDLTQQISRSDLKFLEQTHSMPDLVLSQQASESTYWKDTRILLYLDDLISAWPCDKLICVGVE